MVFEPGTPKQNSPDTLSQHYTEKDSLRLHNLGENLGYNNNEGGEGEDHEINKMASDIIALKHMGDNSVSKEGFLLEMKKITTLIKAINNINIVRQIVKDNEGNYSGMFEKLLSAISKKTTEKINN